MLNWKNKNIMTVTKQYICQRSNIVCSAKCVKTYRAMPLCRTAAPSQRPNRSPTPPPILPSRTCVEADSKGLQGSPSPHDTQPQGEKRVDSLSMISGRSRLLQLVCNHLGHWRWMAWRLSDSSSPSLFCPAPPISMTPSPHPPPTACAFQFPHMCSSGAPLPSIEEEIMSIAVTCGTSPPPRHLHLPCQCCCSTATSGFIEAKCQNSVDNIKGHQRAV